MITIKLQIKTYVLHDKNIKNYETKDNLQLDYFYVEISKCNSKVI